MSEECTTAAIPEQAYGDSGCRLEQSRLHVIFPRFRVDVHTSTDADRISEHFLHDPEQRPKRMGTVADRRQSFPPWAVYDQRIGVCGEPSGVNVFRFHVIRFAEQSFFVKVHQRVDESRFVGVGAGHEFGFGILFGDPQALRLVQICNGRDVGKNVDVFVQRHDTEVSMDVRTGLHQNQIQLLLCQHFRIIGIELDPGEDFIERLVLQPLGFAPKQRINIAGRDEFRTAKSFRRKASHMPPTMPQPNDCKSDFFHASSRFSLLLKINYLE